MTSIIRLPEVTKRTGLSKSEIYRRESLGEFPNRIKLGRRTIGWSDEEVSKWITDVINESRGKEEKVQFNQKGKDGKFIAKI